MSRLKICYFASIREQLGLAAEMLDLPHDVNDVAALVDFLANRNDGAPWALLQDSGSVLVAVDQAVADRTASLKGVQEVAFFPPMTGG
ncbi:MAG: molybdopterin converting factor subunit 1 [Pseudomonadales bacterium]|nr:molybdopterin converting factor subunit 1 [Pseudomonadales bacterium]